jgi:hypothetical protein
MFCAICEIEHAGIEFVEKDEEGNPKYRCPITGAAWYVIPPAATYPPDNECDAIDEFRAATEERRELGPDEKMEVNDILVGPDGKEGKIKGFAGLMAKSLTGFAHGAKVYRPSPARVQRGGAYIDYRASWKGEHARGLQLSSLAENMAVALEWAIQCLQVRGQSGPMMKDCNIAVAAYRTMFPKKAG